MDPSGQLGLIMLKLLEGDSNKSSQDENRMRRIVQEELGRTQNAEQSEFLREVIRMLGDKEKVERKQTENELLKAQVEALKSKLDRQDHNRKVQENREWMKDLIQKFTSVATVPKGGQNFNPKTHDDDLPWFDANKRVATGEDSQFVMVSPEQFASNYRGGRGNRGGRGGQHGGHGQYHPAPEGQGQQMGNFPQGNPNSPQRGGARGRGRGRGAIPKVAMGNKGGDNPLNQGDLKDLTAKLHHLSVSDVNVALSPEEIIRLKNLLSDNNPEKKARARKKKAANADESAEEKPKEAGKKKAAKNDESAEEKPKEAGKKKAAKNDESAEEKPKEAGKKKAAKNDESSEKKTNQAGKKKAANNDESPEKKSNQPGKKKAANNDEKEKKDTPEKPPKKKETADSKAPASPMELHPLPGFSDSVLQILSEDQPVKNAVYMVQDEGKLLTFHPRTVGQLKLLKQKHPEGQLFSSSTTDS